MIDGVEGLPQVLDAVGSVLVTVEWAEDEIAAAQRRWPDRADDLFHAFELVRPPRELESRMAVEAVYRAYARELLDRVGRGEDTRPGTAVEVCLALMAVSMRAPLNHEGFGLYTRMWQAAGLPEIAEINYVSGHYEAISASAIDAAEAVARRETARSGRVVSVDGCCGMHHGVVVDCVYAAEAQGARA